MQYVRKSEVTRSEFIAATYLRATGKPTAPTSGTKKYNQIVAIGEFYTNVWAREPDTDWDSLFDYRNSGTITATDTFALTATIAKPSQQDGDYIRILHTDGETETEYELVSADRLYENKLGFAVAVVGRNLMFSRAFTATDPQFGGTIVVPSYGYATWPTLDASDVTVDDPYWLVTICAAEFVRNDITRKAEYPNLVAEANVLMDKMKENNGGGVDSIYRPNFFVSDEAAFL